MTYLTGRPAARRVLGVAVATMLIQPVFPSAAPAADLAQSIRNIKKSVVGVGSCELTRRPPVKLRGTGFVVADGRHVVTNHHVIKFKLDESKKEFLCLILGQGRRTEIEPAKTVAVDPDHDVAILSFRDRRLPAVRFGDDSRVVDGQEIAFTGFPIGAVLGLYPVTHRGIVSARTPIVIPQKSTHRLNAKMVQKLRQAFTVFQLDATAYPGNSGSPLFDPHGARVLGIVNSVYVKGYKENVLKDPSGISYAVPIEYARRLLRRIGVEMPPDESAAAGAEDQNRRVTP